MFSILPDYSDITSRLGEPLWWDEHGVPRYEEFSPKWCNVYAEYVALIVIACQNCKREFVVAVTESNMNWNHIMFKSSVELPASTSLGSFYYGDPPRHAEERCLAGDTMTSDPIRVLEFWHRGSDPEEWTWHRHPEYEIEIEEDGDEDVITVDR